MINAVNEGPIKSYDDVQPDKKDSNDNQLMPGKNSYEIFWFSRMITLILI